MKIVVGLEFMVIVMHISNLIIRIFLAVNYISDGKILNATIWLASGFENSSAPVYNQPFRKISYGMLIDADYNTKTGYNGR